MADWKKICCAIDFSAPSRVAMEKAADLAKRLDGELTLLHVNEAALATTEETGLSREELAAQAAKEMEPKMAAWHGLAERAMGHPVRKVIVGGKAADEILQFLQVGAYDLLVMGTHGRVGLAHFVIGSVAEEVERHAPCPVLVVRSS